jgi:hypothetical protein
VERHRKDIGVSAEAPGFLLVEMNVAGGRLGDWRWIETMGQAAAGSIEIEPIPVTAGDESQIKAPVLIRPGSE